MKKERIKYYSDPLNDDFAGTDIDTKDVCADYEYVCDNPLFRFGAFVLNKIIVRPLVWLFVKIAHRQKFVNKKIIKTVGKKGAFIYANHTLIPADAFIPNIITIKKYNYIITGPDTVSIKGIRLLVKMLGAIPIASTVPGFKKYNDCIKQRIGEGSIVTIYPEAHIWPYYKDIRPFTPVSFHYPVDLDAPVFVLTNTFRKSKVFSKPRVVTYIDGPFYPDNTLPKKEAIQKLRDEVYEKMVERAATSDQEYIKYIYVPKDSD